MAQTGSCLSATASIRGNCFWFVRPQSSVERFEKVKSILIPRPLRRDIIFMIISKSGWTERIVYVFETPSLRTAFFWSWEVLVTS